MPRQFIVPPTPAELELEEWRPVVGYEGVYSVSNLGRVRRDIQRGRPYKAGTFLKSTRSRTYWTVHLVPPRNRSQYVHVLVAEAFIEPRPLGHECNHKDGNMLNPRAENLEWVTRSENVQHAFRTGLHVSLRGEMHNRAKLTEDAVREIRRVGRMNRGGNVRQLANKFGVSPQTVVSVLNGATWGFVS